MTSVVGVGCLTAERFFQKRHSDTFDSTGFIQSIACPRLAFHHLGKQRQANGDYFVVFDETCDGLLQKLFLLPGCMLWLLGQFAECSTESGQHLAGMVSIKQVD